MIGNVPLVGSLSTGFGDATVQAPTQKTPNLEEASKEFVSMLYSYMFSQMRESGSDQENGLFSGPHVNMLMGFLDQEIGKKMAYSEGSGLADALLRQLKREDPTAAENDKGSQNSDVKSAQTTESAPLQKLTQASNQVQEMTQKAPVEIDNSQQIMEQLYNLNHRE